MLFSDVIRLCISATLNSFDLLLTKIYRHLLKCCTARVSGTRFSLVGATKVKADNQLWNPVIVGSPPNCSILNQDYRASINPEHCWKIWIVTYNFCFSTELFSTLHFEQSMKLITYKPFYIKNIKFELAKNPFKKWILPSMISAQLPEFTSSSFLLSWDERATCLSQRNSSPYQWQMDGREGHAHQDLGDL